MTEDADKRNVCIIAVLGAPASGKGTLCKRLAQEPLLLPIHHVSVGDLLRGMGPSGPDINAHIAKGTVLPGEEIVPIIAKHIASLPTPSPPRLSPAASKQIKYAAVVIMDGFPRNLEQEALARDPLASRPDGLFPDLAIYFRCEKEVLKKRYVERRRGEDDAALFEKRYEQHERECPGVVETYKERGILVEVDTGGDTEQSYQDLVKVLKSSPLGSEIVIN